MLSKHLAQFLIYTNKTVSDQELQNEKEIKGFKSFDKTKFKEELENKEWNQLLTVYSNDLNTSSDIFLKSVNSVLDRHVPLIGVTKLKKLTKNYR